jgi:hypothetical protein
MSNTATTLSRNDQIFATLEVGGKIMASVSKSNFTTINDVVRFICSIAGRFMGLARLSIRNKTQGWTMNMALASRPTHTVQLTAPASQYYQASLFA